MGPKLSREMAQFCAADFEILTFNQSKCLETAREGAMLVQA